MGMHMHFGRGGLDRDDLSLKNVNFSYFPRLLGFVRPYALHLGLAMVLVIVGSILGIIGPLLIRKILDVDILKGDVRQLLNTVYVYLGIQVAIALLRFLRNYIMSWAGQRMLYSMRKKVFVHLQDLGLDFYDGLQVGRIMSRVTSDIDALNQLITSGFLHLLSDSVTLIGIVIIMLQLNAKLALVTLITVPVLLTVVWSLRTRMSRAYHKVRRRMADINANLQESISGMKIVQAFSREDVNADRFNHTNMRNFSANLEAAKFHSAFFPAIEIISTLGVALVVYYGGLRMSMGDTAVTVGTLNAFLNYMNRFFMPIRNITELYNLLLQAGVSSERVFEVLDTVPNVQDAVGAQEIGRVKGHVEFDSVVFGYNPDIPVLRNINIEAKPNETIALVGHTGAGKSTITNLLCRFYDVQGGAIKVDGTDIRSMTIESLRKNLGIVLQDTFIFSGTVMENIRYGRLNATDQEVMEAAQIVGAHRFIQHLPDKYDTEVRERGSRLSVGQRQMLAFARALLADPPILILDEATSSIDAYTEYLIQRALEKLLKGRTSIVIAHRLSTVRNADRIYVIDHGVVKEVGDHEELMARAGVYKDLYEKQFAR
jgi:ATP-binding cassette subfamily B multidrug efflux pump